MQGNSSYKERTAKISFELNPQFCILISSVVNHLVSRQKNTLDSLDFVDLLSPRIWLLYYRTSCVGYASCKEIRDSDNSSASGEYTIRTSTGRILDKVNQPPDYAKMLVSAIRPHNFFGETVSRPLDCYARGQLLPSAPP